MLELFSAIGNNEKRARLVDLRSAVKPILANNILPHFTDHSVEHSDAIVELLSQYLESFQANSEDALTAEELFVLFASCYLHDIGMHYENCGNTKAIEDLKLGQEWEQLSARQRQDILRKHHNELSRELVCSSIRSSHPPIGISLDDGDYAAEIASLCEAHAMSTDSERYPLLTQDTAKVRVSLLVALLRIGDILEESRRRALMHRSESLVLDLESQAHWWRHYYTEHVTIDPKNKQVILHFAFPAEKHIEYEKIVPRLQVPFIEDESKKHERILNRFGLHYIISENCTRREITDSRVMPDDVYKKMVDIVQSRDLVSLEANQEIIAIERNVSIQASAQQLVKVVEDAESFPKNFEAILELSNSLWEKGGRRSARVILSGLFDQKSSQLDPLQRLRFATYLGRLMLEDRASVQSARTLLGVRSIANSVENADKAVAEYHGLLPRALADAWDDRAKSTFEESVQLENRFIDQASLQSDYTVFNTLNGSFEEAEAYARRILEGGQLQGAQTPGLIAGIRVMAMRSGLDTALDALSSAMRIGENFTSEQTVALHLLAADLHRLDFQLQSAKEVFENDIEPHLSACSDDLRIIVLDNKNIVSTALFEADSTQEFYNLLDERKAKRFELWDSNEILLADNYAAKNQYYEALPRYWTELRRNFERSTWRGFAFVAERMANGTLHIEDYGRSVLYAIFAGGDELGAKVGRGIAQTGDSHLIETAADFITVNVKLAAHAGVAAAILQELVDSLPDQSVPKVFEWLLGWARIESLNPVLSRTPRAIWETLWLVAPRLTDGQLHELLETALNHSAWEHVTQLRESIVPVASAAISLGKFEVSNKHAAQCVRLATDLKSDLDYTKSLNLLCALHKKSDESTKKLIEEQLFPPNTSISHPDLLQMAKIIGKELGDVNSWSESARNIADTIKKQVQEVSEPSDAEVVPGSYGTHVTQHQTKNTCLVIQIDSGSYLNLLAAYKDKIDEHAVALLVTAIQDMLNHPDNSIQNKTVLLFGLSNLVNNMPERMVEQVFPTILHLARGRIQEPEGLMSQKESENPMNPFKMKMGDVAQLQGQALMCGALLVKDGPSKSKEEFIQTLHEALTDPNQEVRRSGLSAAYELTTDSPELISTLIMSTRDSSSAVCEMAFAALENQELDDLTEFHMDQLLFSCRMALSSEISKLRRAAALLLSKINMESLSPLNQPKLAELLEQVKSDVCFSVRRVCDPKSG